MELHIPGATESEILQAKIRLGMLTHSEGLPDNLDLLHALKKEISDKIFHLERSNKEIEEFDPEHREEELVLAVNENVSIIHRNRLLLENIVGKISRIEGCHSPAKGQEKPLNDSVQADAVERCNGIDL